MRARRFWKDQKGLAAVEMAFVMPVMLSFLLGLIEVSQAVACRENVTHLAATGADLVGQESTVTGADMQNVFNAMSAILFPYSAAPIKITISSVVDNNTASSGKVAWSCTRGGTARAANSVITIPTGLITQGGGGSIVMTEVTYNYSSAISSYFVGPLAMHNVFYSKPRLVAQIPLQSCT